DRESDSTDDQARSEKYCGCRCSNAWAAAFHPRSTERRAQAEKHKGCRECRVGRTEPPGLIRKESQNWPVQRAPCIDRTNTDVNSDGANGNPPSIHSPLRNGYGLCGCQSGLPSHGRGSCTSRGRLLLIVQLDIEGR